MVSVSMLRGEFPFKLILACVAGMLSVGCFGNKNKDVAVIEAAPPAAAYPETPGYAESTTPAMTPTAPAPPSSSIAAATANVPAPQAFELREGEQLVEYQIQRGDSLEAIAIKFNTSYRRIMAANGMSGDKIIAGKSIQVPTSAPPSNLAMNSNTPAPAAAPAPSLYRNTVAPSPGAISAPPVAPAASTTPAASGAPYPSAIAPPIKVPSGPASTSYPRVAPSQPGSAFPTPSFGGSQFSQ